MYSHIYYADEENRYLRCTCGSLGGTSDALGGAGHTHSCMHVHTHGVTYRDLLRTW